MSSNTIKLIIEVERGEDQTYSLSLEDAAFDENDDRRYVNGLSEGYVTDLAEVGESAGSVVQRYIAGLAKGKA